MPTLIASHTLGEPQTAGPLVLFPIFGPEPQLEYITFAEAINQGTSVHELPQGADVRCLLVSNDGPLPVLLFEGEEVIGAQQNRTFDLSVLVAAGTKVEVPVSCVEHGRWDGGRANEGFTVPSHTADPHLRRTKRVATNARAAAGLALQADQGEVWREVASRVRVHRVNSPSEALSDVFAARGSELAQLAEPLELIDGQIGSLVFISGQPTAVDLVSRPDAYASLHSRLVRGYALEALGQPPRASDSDAADRFLARVAAAQKRRVPVPGRGEGLVVAGDRLVGGGLECEDEVIQLSVFTAEDSDSAGPSVEQAGAILRPSRRRR